MHRACAGASLRAVADLRPAFATASWSTAMAIQDPALKLTYEDLADLPDDGKRHELIDGEHFVTGAPWRKHQGISMTLTFEIGHYVGEHSAGWLYHAPLDVVLSNVDVVVPDLVFVSRERAEILTDRNIAGAPDLVIEVLSETTRRRDEVIKRKLYERFGVREYWVIDAELEQVKVYRHTAKGYGQPQILSAEAGDRVETPLLPGLSIPLVKLFA
jgi:Uma2 family endonuclease